MHSNLFIYANLSREKSKRRERLTRDLSTDCLTFKLYIDLEAKQSVDGFLVSLLLLFLFFWLKLACENKLQYTETQNQYKRRPESNRSDHSSLKESMHCSY